MVDMVKIEGLSIGKLRLHYLHRANEDLRAQNFDAAREDIKSFLRTLDGESVGDKGMLEKILYLLEKEAKVEKAFAKKLKKMGYPERAIALNLIDQQYRKRYLEMAINYAWKLAQKERLFEEV